MKLRSVPFILTTAIASTLALAESPSTQANPDAVTISANPLLRALYQEARPVNILTGDDLKLRLASTVGETLSSEVGITSTSFAPGASRPIIRGLGDDRIRILNNGVNTIDVANVSPDHQVTSDPLTIDTIEVVRGPATLLYGPNSVGGVVNIIDGRIPSEKPDRAISGRLDGRFGTVDQETSGAGEITLSLGPVAIRLGGFKRQTQDVDIPSFARSARLRREQPLDPGETEAKGTLPNSFMNSEGATIGGSYFWEGGTFGASYGGVDSSYGTVGEPDVTIDLRQRRFDARGAFFEPFTGVKAINYKFAQTDYRHTEFEGPLPGTLFETEGYDGRIELVHQKLGLLEGLIGYQGQHTDFSALGAEAFLPPVTTDIQSVFLFEELPFDKVRLQFGMRYDHQSNDSSGGLNFGPAKTLEFDSLSGSAGIVWTPVEDYAVALSLAYTERAPTYVELFANGPHVATNTFEIGDTDLGLERSVGVDLSLRKRLGRITGAVSVFYNHFTDYIALTPDGTIADDLPVYLFAPVDARFFGGEIETTFHLIQPISTALATSGKDGKSLATPATPSLDQTLDLTLKADYVRAEIDGGGALPRIPPFRAQAALSYTLDRFNARVEGIYAARQNHTADFELPTDDYFLVNASVGYRMPVGPTSVDLYVRGTNLTNAEARQHASFLKDIAPLPGRGVLFGVRAEF